MQQATEYHRLLCEAGLKQRDLAALLGVDATTVNRWDGEGQQARPAPRYAVQFLRAYILLSPDDRLSLYRQ